MQQARSDHFVLAKLRRDVLKHGVAGGLRYGFGGLHQPVEIVSGQSQSQLIQWGHGKRSTKNKNAATGLWFSYRVPEILTLGRFPDARESDSTWRTQEVRHVGSDTIAPRFWCVPAAWFGEEDERRPSGPSASGARRNL